MIEKWDVLNKNRREDRKIINRNSITGTNRKETPRDNLLRM